MNKKAKFILVSCGCAIALALLMATGSNTTEAQEASGTSQEELIARGKYLTHYVAMCVQCHSPRDAQGNIIESRKFTGSRLQVDSNYSWSPDWAEQAPRIAGFPGYSDWEAKRLLTKGITRRGDVPRAPMPPFRLSEEDAEAVIAYLRNPR